MALNPPTQLSFTVAAIVFFVFYIPHHYCDKDQSVWELQVRHWR
jgi:hypothetical protein